MVYSMSGSGTRKVLLDVLRSLETVPSDRALHGNIHSFIHY
jgi:hypothetical protein